MRGESLLRFRRIRSRFLREAPLQDFQLRVKLVDFVRLVIGGQRFLPFRKGAFEKVRGALVLSRA